jgi:hypothetical protein
VRIVALAALLGAAALALPLGAAAAPEKEQRQRLQVPRDLRVVSYYPADAGWTLMWEHWRPERIAADFRRLRGLNANTVRLIVFPERFGYPLPTERYADRLAQAVDLARAAGLHVQLTLFDWWYDYLDRTGSKRWLRALLAPYVGDARVAFVELRNEIDTADAAAVEWARELVPWLRGYLRGVPVTISVAAADSVGGVRALARGLGPASRPDFFTAHYFTGGGELAASVFERLRRAAAPTPLWIGELGYPTSSAVSGYSALPRTSSSQEAAQSHFLKTGFEAARRVGLPAPGIWILDDFAPAAIPPSDVSAREPEYTFGLFRADGSPKLAAGTVRRLFRRGPELGFNGGFEQAVTGDDGSQRPAMWAAIGLDGMAVERDTNVAHTGEVSVRLRSAAAAYGQLSVAPIETAVREGRCAEAAAWSRGRAAAGRVRLVIGWFDASFRRVARRSDRLPLEGGRWRHARVRACPPRGAVYARILVEAVGLQGVAWVDDVTFGWR